MSWATPVRSHVVVTMMARSITVERSVPALLGLARVSRIGIGMGLFHLSGFRALRWTSKNIDRISNYWSNIFNILLWSLIISLVAGRSPPGAPAARGCSRRQRRPILGEHPRAAGWGCGWS